MEVWQVMEGIAWIPAGTVLQLSDAQMDSRQHQLKALAEAGWFEALESLMFKAGDVLTFQSPLDKATLQALMPPEMKKPIVGHPNHRPKRQKDN